MDGCGVVVSTGKANEGQETWLPLVGRIAAGDRQAEGQLIGQFRAGIYALARRHCRPGDPAVDDVVQDVICHLLEQLRRGSIKDPRALPAYIRTSVVNACTSEYRRRRMRAESVPLDDVVMIAPDAHDPAIAFQNQRVALAIRQLVAEMPVQRDRELLVRFYLNEADKERICAELGIEAGHFHRVIYRARERFRTLLVRAGLVQEGGTTAPLPTPETQEVRRDGGQRSA
jgi:RNA polymerase sigma-70 factor (ECF subfamily)